MFLKDIVNNVRPRISSIPVNEPDDDKSESGDSVERGQQNNAFIDNNENEDFASASEFVNTFIDAPIIPKKKRKANSTETQEYLSTSLLKYILEKKDVKPDEHPIDNFFSLMAKTVKTFSPIDQHFVKRRLFALVSEMEEKYLISPSSSLNENIQFRSTNTFADTPMTLPQLEASFKEESPDMS